MQALLFVGFAFAPAELPAALPPPPALEASAADQTEEPEPLASPDETDEEPPPPLAPEPLAAPDETNEEPPPPLAPEPLAAPDEADEEPPPPLAPEPLAAPDETDAPPSGKATSEGEPEGLSAFSRGSLQIVSGCATVAAITALSSIPIVGWYCIGPLSLCLTPALIGIVETTVGDFAGQTRGAFLWPVLGAYATQLLGVGLTLGATVAVAAVLGQNIFALVEDPSTRVPDPGTFFATILGSYAIVIAVAATGSLLTAAGTVLTSALVYGLTADPKQPGDDDFRLPGLFSPAHATPVEVEAPPAPAAPSVSMAY